MPLALTQKRKTNPNTKLAGKLNTATKKSSKYKTRRKESSTEKLLTCFEASFATAIIEALYIYQTQNSKRTSVLYPTVHER